jgi:GT2 family glycosyltransferase
VQRLPVYLIHWRAIDWCAAAAASVAASSVPVDLFIVDNGGSGGSDLRDQLPDGVVVLESAANLGYTGAANLALRHWLGAGGDASPWAVVASHDLDVEPDTFEVLLREADRRLECGIVGPALLANPSSSGGIWTRDQKEQLPFDAATTGTIRRAYISGTCMMLRRECARHVGLFDESFGSYTEDVDYCLRAGDGGWHVYVATDAHARGRGSAFSGLNTWLVPTNRLRLARKRSGPSGLLRAAAPYAVELVRSAAGAVAPGRSPAARAASRQALVKRRYLVGSAIRLLRAHDIDLPAPPAP